MPLVERERSADIRAEIKPLERPTEAEQLTLSPPLLAARLESSLPEVVAEEMPVRLRLGLENPVNLNVNPHPEMGRNKLKYHEYRRGSGRSRRERCPRCGQKQHLSFGFNSSNDCQTNVTLRPLQLIS